MITIPSQNMKKSSHLYECSICDKSYKTAGGLHQHKYYKHSSKRPEHTCTYCDYTHYIKGTMRQHLMSCPKAKLAGYVSPSSLFKCDLCKYTAKQKGNLSAHRFKMHNIPRPSTRITRNTTREQLLIPKYISVKSTTSMNKCWVIQHKDTGVKLSSTLYSKNQCQKELYDIHTLNGLFEGFRMKNPLFLKEWSSFQHAVRDLVDDRPRIRWLNADILRHFDIENIVS